MHLYEVLSDDACFQRERRWLECIACYTFGRSAAHPPLVVHAAGD